MKISRQLWLIFCSSDVALQEFSCARNSLLSVHFSDSRKNKIKLGVLNFRTPEGEICVLSHKVWRLSRPFVLIFMVPSRTFNNRKSQSHTILSFHGLLLIEQVDNI